MESTINIPMIIAIILLALIILLLISNVRIVSQSNAYVIERLGNYRLTWNSGLHFKIPFIELIALKVSLKEHVVDFPPQPVITKDNVTILIDTVVYFQITDPKRFAYGAENPMSAIENLAATTLRNIIGDMELDSTLTSRENINGQIRIILDEATDPWGIKVNRVEVKNIDPPKEIKQAMEKQMRAEREKRESILRAEGTKQAAILVAEGAKEASILEAEGKKQATIKSAEAQSQSILMLQRATAQGIELVNESAPSKATVILKSYETMEKVADGKATKLIIPSDLQAMAGLTGSLVDIVDGVKGKKSNI